MSFARDEMRKKMMNPEAPAPAAAPGSGQAEFDKWLAGQGGHARKKKKSAWWDNWNQDQKTQGVMAGYVNNPSGGFSLHGTGAQQAEQAANLSQVGVQTGQNMFQTGAQNQEYLSSLQDRRSGADTVGQYMMDGRNRSMANTGRQFAGRGIAGGVAAAGMSSAQNAADSSINAEKFKNARTGDQDLFNFVKRQQKVEGGAIAMGKDQALAQNMNVNAGEGITVICTELHRQGLMDDDTYLKDAEFGRNLLAKDPLVMVGYIILATPIVKLMQKSKVFTRLVSIPALAWAENMAGERNLAGKTIMLAGIPLCRIVGKLSTLGEGKYEQLR